MSTFEKELISVIIPVYNAEKYLRRCLESVLNNSYRNIEVICVNDGSTDNSLEILNKIASEDKRVRVINQDNGGESSARNRGLSIARGNFISFIDSDDWVHFQYFEILMKGFEDSSVDVSICGNRRAWINEEIVDGNICAKFQKGNFDELLCLKDYDALRKVWGMIYRKSLIGEMRFVEGVSFAPDTLFNFQLFCSVTSLKYAYTEVPLYYYFQNECSAIHVLGGENLLLTSKMYQACINSGRYSNKSMIILVIQLNKMLLACRYLTMYMPNHKQIENECNEIYIDCKKLVELPYKQRFRYRLMWKFPIIYRIYRIGTDRTMLDWEKAEREKYGRDIDMA